MPKTQTMQSAFVEEIRDLYDAEKQLVRALPKMAKAASSEELREAFQEHLQVTKEQVARLEEVFEKISEKPRSKACRAMKGLVEEGQEIIAEDTEEHLHDLALIGAAQKIEHYEIAGYGTVRTFAQAMGNKEVAQLLEQTLKEEEATDKKLTQIAKSLYKAAQKTERNSGNAGNGRSSGRRSRGSQADMESEEFEEIEA